MPELGTASSGGARRRRWWALPVAAVVLGAAVACSSGGGHEGTGPPGGGDRDAVAAKLEADEERLAEKQMVTDPALFRPFLAKAVGALEWPAAYTMSADDIWPFVEPAIYDTILVEDDARSLAGIWNTCAWTLQLVDVVTADPGSPAIGVAVEHLEAANRSEPYMAELVAEVADGAKLGDLSEAQQFIVANDCHKGFDG